MAIDSQILLPSTIDKMWTDNQSRSCVPRLIHSNLQVKPTSWCTTWQRKERRTAAMSVVGVESSQTLFFTLNALGKSTFLLATTYFNQVNDWLITYISSLWSNLGQSSRTVWLHGCIHFCTDLELGCRGLYLYVGLKFWGCTRGFFTSIHLLATIHNAIFFNWLFVRHIILYVYLGYPSRIMAIYQSKGS